MPLKTALYNTHLAHAGKMVDFAGWAMPIHYGSQIEEHHAVRTAAGMFDVSHMTVIDIISDVAESFLQYLLANNVARLKHGQALYSCMLNDDGGVIDDLIVYFIKRGFYRMVVNAATREKDLAWINQIADKFNITPQERADVSMIAVQGPQAIERSLPFLPESLKNQAAELHRFQACLNDKYCVARTGYTGEDGFEVMLPSTEVEKFWAAFAENGIRPAGLGARDTLRLEAGMNLYGNDMDESVTPLESGLAWTVAWEPQDRNFVGRTALEKQRKAGVAKKLVGLKLTDRGVLRAHQKVYSSAGEGEITSGTFSPTLKQTIAMARVPKDMGSACEVEIRSKRLAAEVVKYPFVRDGKSMID